MKLAEKKSPPRTPLAAATVALSAAVCLTAPGVSPVIKGGRGTQASSSKEILDQEGGGEKGGREQSTVGSKSSKEGVFQGKGKFCDRVKT